MTIPSILTIKFKIFQKVELIDLCTERFICVCATNVVADILETRDNIIYVTRDIAVMFHDFSVTELKCLSYVTVFPR